MLTVHSSPASVPSFTLFEATSHTFKFFTPAVTNTPPSPNDDDDDDDDADDTGKGAAAMQCILSPAAEPLQYSAEPPRCHVCMHIWKEDV